MKRIVLAVVLATLVALAMRREIKTASAGEILQGDASLLTSPSLPVAGSQGTLSTSAIAQSSQNSAAGAVSGKAVSLISGQADPSIASAGPTTAPSVADIVRAANYKTVRGTAGFWRVAQDQSGVWWFLSPTGQRQFLNTVTTVQPELIARDKTGVGYKSLDWNGKDDDASMHQWASATLERVQSLGFKGLGAWCNPAFHKLDVPMTQDLNIWAWMQGAQTRFYHPDWKTVAEHAIAVQVDPLRDNKNLVGYFTDNELDWGQDSMSAAEYFDFLDQNDPNRQQVIGVIRQLWPTTDDFNTDWKTHFSSWSDLDKLQSLPSDASSAYTRLQSAWLSHLARDYFRLTTALLRKHDRNHLILGVRFKGFAPREVVAAAKNEVDAISINYYVDDARLDMDMFQMMNDVSGLPVVISEYSFHALDSRSGDPDTVGFVAQVPDQQARADGYRLLTTRLARVPYVIGADWFQWSDEPPSGRASDGEDVNFGIVDVYDRPYEMLADAVRQTSPKLNPMHEQSASDDEKDVWRDTFATKPVMHVPYLAQAPAMDGQLDNWSPEMKVQGVRHSQVVGLERSPLPAPNVYMGWTKQGLYLGLEVFDHDPLGASAKAWWWTRDFAEFFFSTRPVASDENEYTPYCHQFFFVPNSDGLPGTVGQWHRDGDALKDNLIPHPTIKESVQVLSDRYVVKMFIPGSALHGYDPVAQPAMAFNVHVRNFRQAMDYFWSAPKEVLTQQRPSTWGTLYLEPPPKDAADHDTASAFGVEKIASPAQVQTSPAQPSNAPAQPEATASLDPSIH